MPEININLVDLPADVQKYMMRFLSPADLVHLSATNRHFNNMVNAHLAANSETQHAIKVYRSQHRHRLFTNINNHIEDEMDHLPADSFHHIVRCVIGAAACVSIGLIINDYTITRNTLFAAGALLLSIGIALSIQYIIINRRIDQAYHQLNRLDDMETGRLSRFR